MKGLDYNKEGETEKIVCVSINIHTRVIDDVLQVDRDTPTEGPMPSVAEQLTSSLGVLETASKKGTRPKYDKDIPYWT